jgi:hypothetical protein
MLVLYCIGYCLWMRYWLIRGLSTVVPYSLMLVCNWHDAYYSAAAVMHCIVYYRLLTAGCSAARRAAAVACSALQQLLEAQDADDSSSSSISSPDQVSILRCWSSCVCSTVKQRLRQSAATTYCAVVAAVTAAVVLVECTVDAVAAVQFNASCWENSAYKHICDALKQRA